MTATKVRADYESLAGMAARFGAQAGDTRLTLQQLLRQVEVLRDGDWVGQGADAFYQEITTTVLPRVRRLAEALESAQHTTSQIRQIMQQAEAEAARVLRGEDDGVVAEAADEAGPIGGDALAGAPAAAGPAFIANIRGPNARAIRQAMARRKAAAENAAVDKMLSIFEPRIREMVKKSPTLRTQMLTLQQEGFIFLTGPLEDGHTFRPPFITIGQPIPFAETLGIIAHETGHGVNDGKVTTVIAETPSMLRAEYVQLNVAHYLRKEAAAQFNALRVRAELQAAGAGDISVPGTMQDAAYLSAYTDYTAGRISQDEAIDRMRLLVTNDPRSDSKSGQTYGEYAIKHFENDWDTYIAPTRKQR